jgi:hypothetical protein
VLIGGNLLAIGVAIILYLLVKSIIPVFLLVASSFSLSALYLYSLVGKKGKEEKDLTSEFVRIFEYYGIFVKNGLPVYSALEGVIPFCSSSMEDKLRELLKGIGDDKSVTPYVHFASYFPSLAIKEVMVSVFLMSEQGGSENYLRQFSLLFDSLASDERKVELEKRLERQSNLSALPLLGAGLTMLLITVGLIAIIGGVLNGL